MTLDAGLWDLALEIRGYFSNEEDKPSISCYGKRRA